MSPDPPELQAGPMPPQAAESGSGRDPAAVRAPGTPPAEVDSDPAEEVEVWWGGYSGWALTPSFVVCLLITAFIVWASWHYLPRHLFRVTATVAASLVWGVQFVRFGVRVLGFNYRLTTRRLLLSRGVRRLRVRAIELARVRRVTPETSGLEALFGVGRVYVHVEGEAAPHVLPGVRNPRNVAALIRAAAQAAQAGK